MATKALLVRLEAKPGKERAVEEFLLSALPLVEQEPGTKPWFAIRFGPSTFGIIDAFPDEKARETHLEGPVGTKCCGRDITTEYLAHQHVLQSVVAIPRQRWHLGHRDRDRHVPHHAQRLHSTARHRVALSARTLVDHVAGPLL